MKTVFTIGTRVKCSGCAIQACFAGRGTARRGRKVDEPGSTLPGCSVGASRCRLEALWRAGPFELDDSAHLAMRPCLGDSPPRNSWVHGCLGAGEQVRDHWAFIHDGPEEHRVGSGKVGALISVALQSPLAGGGC